VNTYCLPPILEASEEAKARVRELLAAQGILTS
jgi:4-hydroxy-tetrahydrodipicolinate synthase